MSSNSSNAGSDRIVGIFATWNFNFFDKPENVLRKNLDENPTYPFEEVGHGVYMMTVKSSRFGVALAICALLVASTVVAYVNIGAVNEYMIYPLVFLLAFSHMAAYNWKHRTYILDRRNQMYEFYRGDRLIFRGHYHNIYIRLKGEKTGSGSTYFSVVLNGCHMDEQSVSSSTTYHDKMAKLGRRLAYRLDLNFFDCTDKSRYHVIRHRCPYRESAASSVVASLTSIA